MRIGIMLRHLGQHGGGVRVYTENLLGELLSLDSGHEFVLMYRDPRLVGTYASREHVREVALSAPTKLLWDQLAVARAVSRERIDLVFNPKYSVPLVADADRAFVCHGLDWYVEPAWSRRRDRLSHRFLIPRYAARADVILAVSETTRRDVVGYLGVEESRVRTVYHGVDDAFRHPPADAEIARVRAAHGLPERFYLFCGQIYPPKNFGRLIRAYASLGPPKDIALVVAGRHTWLSKDEIALIDRLDLGRQVLRLGWVGREDLAALYRQAEALVMPSLYESFGLPVLEAMAAGCPVLTSDRGGTREIAGGAALLVDPDAVESIAEGMHRIVNEPELRERLVRSGRARAAEFTWERCARETLAALERPGVDRDRAMTGTA